MRSTNDVTYIVGFVERVLVGSQFDSFHVYSLELQMNFSSQIKGKLQSVWLCVTGDVSIGDRKNYGQDRVEAVSDLYCLLGRTISAASIEDNCRLVLQFDEQILTAGPDEDGLEVVWSLTPKSSDSNVEKEWSIACTDTYELILSTSS